MELFERVVSSAVGPSCIDLFSGAGGLAVGFRSSGFAILAGNDSETAAGDTFRLNFPEASFFLGEVSELNADSLLAECALDEGDLDCLVGGPPCQSFSYNNHHRTADDERARLFKHYLRLVGSLMPKTIVMENVPGILTIADGDVIREILDGLTDLGFDADYDILSAEQYGTPQIRRRVFIVASRIGPARELLPSPTHWSPKLSAKGKRTPCRPDGANKQLVSVWQAISDLPDIGNGGGTHIAEKPRSKPTTAYQREARRGAPALYNHACHTLKEVNLERIKHVPEAGNWRDVPRKLLPAGMQRARLTDHTKRYGRLARSGLASTILTKCDPHWGAYIHPTQNRTITVREAARLQGFPDSFQFAGESLSKQYVQVGNAVPVHVASAVASATNNHLQRWQTERSKKRAA